MLETDRCILLKLHGNNYEEIKKLYLNEKVRKFLGGTIESEQYRDRFSDMNKSEDGSVYLVVRYKENNEFMGLVSLGLHHDEINTEISYQFLPQFWGHGYAKETIEKVINFAFEELKLTKIVAETQLANALSCKLLKKVGMQLEKTVQRFGDEQGIFSIINDDK